MGAYTDPSPVLWPLAVYTVAVVLLVALMLIASALLGQHHAERSTGEPYECGIESAGTAWVRFHAGFYLVAMFFVIFDLEAAFIYAYAAAFRELGWSGYIDILIFIGVFASSLFYLWRLGALDWRTPRQRSEAQGRRGGRGR